MRPSLPLLPHVFPEFETHLHRLFCTRRSYHKLSRVPRRVRVYQSPHARTRMANDTAGSYEQWTHEQLVTRIKELEAKTAAASPPGTVETGKSPQQVPYRKPPKQAPKAFDPSKYNTRFIALKFAYLGQNYQGFEHHKNNKTPLPTIEEEIWKAMMKTRIIFPTESEAKEGDGYAKANRRTFTTWDREGADVNWDGCEYSKCGRTDKGVSAFGQVIGIRVRSNRPLPKPKLASPPSEPSAAVDQGVEAGSETRQDSVPSDSETEEPKPFNDLTDELPYIELLNRVLPPDIRVYAWCPNPPPDFSARFSCKERRYKYFFTNPCFAPPPGPSSLYTTTPTTANQEENATTTREGWLDIAKMQEACTHLIGLHDFRNFCKIDASKQLTNFNRRIFHAEIEEISPLSIPSFLSHPSINSTTDPTADQQKAPKLYSFTLHGSAFLWHQVRSLVAILFLVGQGLEAPSIVPALLDIAANPTRPKYEMASDAPLVLWDCIFPHAHEVQGTEERQHGYEDRLDWVYVGDAAAARDPAAALGKCKWGRGGVVDDVWEVWRKNKVDETLSGLLLDRIAGLGRSSLDAEPFRVEGDVVGNDKGVCRVFDGGNVGRAKGGVYTPLLERERQEAVEVVNERYAKRKGLDAKKMQGRDDEADE